MSSFRTLVAAVALAVLLAGCDARSAVPPNAAVTAPASSAPPASPAPSPSPKPVRWHVTIRELPATIRDGMIATGTWHQGCPVPLDDLRLVTVSYWGFDGTGHVGRLVVHQDAARPIAEVMHTLFTSRYPIRRMIPVQAFGGNDGRSMAVDNTSAFNCRDVRGSNVWSQHAYGRAIDVNPRENPEVVGAIVRPKHARKYADRSLHAEGMIYPGDVVVQAFSAVGWGWGGYWHSLKDWQHFSANGR